MSIWLARGTITMMRERLAGLATIILIAVSTVAQGQQAPVSVWSGVCTDAQADRGNQLQSGVCSKCHGSRLNGAGELPDEPPSPAIARAAFLQRWEGRTVEALLGYLRTTMPLDNPGQLTDQQCSDIIAYMFQVSGMPAGDKELPPDPSALSGLVINAKAP